MIETIHQYTWLLFVGVFVLIIQHTHAAYCTELKNMPGKGLGNKPDIHKGHSLPSPHIEQSLGVKWKSTFAHYSVFQYFSF